MRIFDMKIVRGDTCYIGLKVNGLPDGQELYGVEFTVRKGFRDQEISIYKDMDDGIEIDDDGKYIICICRTNTKNLQRGHYVYDLKITTLTGKLTIVNGIFDIR